MLAFVRAVVMLAVLVGLPAAWIYYGPLPPGAQKFVDRVVEIVKDATGWQQPVENFADTKTAPHFSAVEAAPTFSAETIRSLPQASRTLPVGLAEQAEPLLERLRALGPTEYALEPWGQGGGFFRFRCAMPLGADHEATRQFEAVTESPLASIEQVVAEVTNWRMARASESQFQ